MIEYDAIQRAIGRQIEEIEAIDIALQELVGKSEAAGRYQKLLSATEIKSEKNRIHAQCETELGGSSPGRLQNEFREHSKALIRRRAKFLSDAQARVRILSIGVTKVVIDGNNMCHMPIGKRFIGVSAIKAAAASLIKMGIVVVVVFDPTIRKLHGCPRGGAATAWLRHQLSVQFVMIVPSGSSADEYVLREARDIHSAVISRDNYDEPGKSLIDYPALREGRVFRHHITDGRVAIPALDIDTPWSD